MRDRMWRTLGIIVFIMFFCVANVYASEEVVVPISKTTNSGKDFSVRAFFKLSPIVAGEAIDGGSFFNTSEIGSFKSRDYDDIFDAHPHEVGVSWGTGTIFGSRYYKTHQDIYDEIGDKMIFSIEDDLDYAIAMDSLLYARYESTLTNMIRSMDGDVFETLFDQVEKELTPFYNDNDLILQSQYDLKPTSLELWQNNIQEKQALLENRLELMKVQLEIQTNL